MVAKGGFFEKGILAIILVAMLIYACPGYAQVGKPIATADGENSGLRVDVQELKRSSGGTITLKFTMVNDSGGGVSFQYDFRELSQRQDEYTISGVQLVDPAGKKKYPVIRDGEGNCLCSRGIANLASKSRSNLWAKFPAPPGDVKKLSIVIPHFMPMDDVPIGQ
jgi:hypothetical protein